MKSATKGRVSKDAVDQMKEVAEHLIKHITENAEVVALNAKRKTIHENDIRVVLSQKFPHLKFPEVLMVPIEED